MNPTFRLDFYHVTGTVHPNDFVVEPMDSLTAAIVGAAKAIFTQSNEKIFTSSDIKNANSILNKLLNTLKSINYNDLDNYSS